MKHPEIPLTYLPWLQATDSLTERARQLTDDITIRVMKQEVMSCQSLLREIYLTGEGTAWWYARTVIPQSTYQARQQQFDNLGTRPLADLLYGDPLITRRQLEFYCIDKGHPEFKWAQQGIEFSAQTNSLWARYSIFDIASSPLYLWEIFLPALWERLQCEK